VLTASAGGTALLEGLEGGFALGACGLAGQRGAALGMGLRPGTNRGRAGDVLAISEGMAGSQRAHQGSGEAKRPKDAEKIYGKHVFIALVCLAAAFIVVVLLGVI
jgi:hypothetical protein